MREFGRRRKGPLRICPAVVAQSCPHLSSDILERASLGDGVSSVSCYFNFTEFPFCFPNPQCLLGAVRRRGTQEMYSFSGAPSDVVRCPVCWLELRKELEQTSSSAVLGHNPGGTGQTWKEKRMKNKTIPGKSRQYFSTAHMI